MPAWAHSGRELFYRGGDGFLVAVDVLPGTTFDWGEERTLFPVGRFVGAWPHPFDLTEDDERFVFMQGPEDPSLDARLIVIRNFSEVLEGLFR